MCRVRRLWPSAEWRGLWPNEPLTRDSDRGSPSRLQSSVVSSPVGSPPPVPGRRLWPAGRPGPRDPGRRVGRRHRRRRRGWHPAGNALSLAAARVTLKHVLTDMAFEEMISVADRYTAGAGDILASRGLPWTITQLGARAEYRICPNHTQERGRVGGGRRRRTRRVPASVPGKPRHPADPVSATWRSCARRHRSRTPMRTGRSSPRLPASCLAS